MPLGLGRDCCGSVFGFSVCFVVAFVISPWKLLCGLVLWFSLVVVIVGGCMDNLRCSFFTAPPCSGVTAPHLFSMSVEGGVGKARHVSNDTARDRVHKDLRQQGAA